MKRPSAHTCTAQVEVEQLRREVGALLETVNVLGLHLSNLAASLLSRRGPVYDVKEAPCCLRCRRLMRFRDDRGRGGRWRCTRPCNTEARRAWSRERETATPSELAAHPYCRACKRRMKSNGSGGSRWHCRGCGVSCNKQGGRRTDRAETEARLINLIESVVPATYERDFRDELINMLAVDLLAKRLKRRELTRAKAIEYAARLRRQSPSRFYRGDLELDKHSPLGGRHSDSFTGRLRPKTTARKRAAV